MNKNYCQHTFGAIANFVVSSRSRFARNIIFNRKYSVPKFATDAKRENVICDYKPNLHKNETTFDILIFCDDNKSFCTKCALRKTKYL